MLNDLFKRKNKFSPQPKIGDKIKIIWLNYNNAWPEPNCYIGTEGIVDYLYDNGGFCLKASNMILCVTSDKYKYVKIN